MTTNTINKLALILAIIFVSSLTNCQNPIPVSDTEEHEESDLQSSHTIPVSQRWGFGFLAGFGISLIGFLTALLIVWFKNLTSEGCFQMTIKFLFSLAFGALLGDAMIHILPQAYKSEGSDFRVVAAIFIGAILFFLILQRLFERCGITHKHWHGDQHSHAQNEGSQHHHNHQKKIHNEDPQKQNPQNVKVKVERINSSNLILENNELPDKKSKSDGSGQQNQLQGTANKNQLTDDDKSCWQNLKGKGSSGYMNLLGSLIHNFMDGLALGVAFATGDKKVFIPVLVAIIAHEIPRQMGDVAILMTASFNATQTVLCNGFVNLTALVGVLIGLAITELSDVAKVYILVFVAGNFIFIAADIWKHLFKNAGILRNFIQFMGFGIGIAAMYLILLIETQQGHAHNQ